MGRGLPIKCFFYFPLFERALKKGCRQHPSLPMGIDKSAGMRCPNWWLHVLQLILEISYYYFFKSSLFYLRVRSRYNGVVEVKAEVSLHAYFVIQGCILQLPTEGVISDRWSCYRLTGFLLDALRRQISLIIYWLSMSLYNQTRTQSYVRDVS